MANRVTVTGASPIILGAVTSTGATDALARVAVGVQDCPRVLPLCSRVTYDPATDGELFDVGRVDYDPADYAITGRVLTLTLVTVGDVSGTLVADVQIYDIATGLTVVAISVLSPSTVRQTVVVTPPGAAILYGLRIFHTSGVGYITLSATLRLTWS